MMATSPMHVDKNDKNMVSTNPMVMQVQASEPIKENYIGC